MHAFLDHPPPTRIVVAPDDHGRWLEATINRQPCLRILCAVDGDADHWCWVDGRPTLVSCPRGCALIAPPGHPILAGDHPATMANTIIDQQTIICRERSRARQHHPTRIISGSAAEQIRHLGAYIGLCADDGLRLQALALAWEHLQQILREAPGTTPLARDHVAAVCRIIDDDLQADLGRDQLAAAVGIHPNHLSRLFARHLGCSLTRWINQRRLDRAQRLIREGVLPCGQAGLAAGFASHARFAQVCRQLRGCSPSQL